MKNTIVATLISFAAFSAFAADNSAYLTDSSGAIVRSSDGLCWNTGYSTPSATGCAAEAAKPKTAQKTSEAEPVSAMVSKTE